MTILECRKPKLQWQVTKYKLNDCRNILCKYRNYFPLTDTWQPQHDATEYCTNYKLLQFLWWSRMIRALEKSETGVSTTTQIHVQYSKYTYQVLQLRSVRPVRANKPRTEASRNFKFCDNTHPCSYRKVKAHGHTGPLNRRLIFENLY